VKIVRYTSEKALCMSRATELISIFGDSLFCLDAKESYPQETVAQRGLRQKIKNILAR
jgi:hypothetical protein